MPSDSLKYLFDIQQACKRLNTFTNNKTKQEFMINELLRSAVERQFEIIGEALNQLLKKDPQWASHISHCSRIIAFRNYLIHGYADIDDEVVWGILETNLPILTREITSLLNDSKADKQSP
ncbi:MAG: DUF86 domain-containing protein [Magnetococcales bacterium]|nr:DUF86 domain-containing protein [Magnetococcales bacterium]